MISSYASWQTNLGKDTSLDKAIADFGYQTFKQHATTYKAWLAENPVLYPAVKAEPDDDEGSGVKDLTKGSAKKETKPVMAPELDYLDNKLYEDPEVQFGGLVVEALKQEMLSLADSRKSEALVHDLEAVEKMVFFTGGAHEAWMQALGGGAGAELAKALQAVKTCFACGLQDQSLRPPVADARAARRLLNGFSSPCANSCDLAKAMATLQLGKAAMSLALEHSKAGIEDENALTMLKGAVLELESFLEPHSSDFVLWILGNDEQVGMDIQMSAEFMDKVKQVLRATMGSLVRLSAVGMEGGLSDMISGLNNCALAMQMAGAILLLDLRRALASDVLEVVRLQEPDDAEQDPIRSQINMPTTTAATIKEEDADESDSTTEAKVLQRLHCDATSIRDQLVDFGIEVGDTLKQIIKCLKAILQRTTEEPGVVDLLGQAQESFDRHASNMTEIQDCIDYLVAGCALRVADLAPQSDYSKMALESSHHSSLCSFSRAHLAHMGSNGFTFALTDFFDGIDSIDQAGTFQAIVGQYFAKVGCALYEQHTIKQVTNCIAEVMKHRVEVGVVHESVLVSAPADKVLGYLIKSPAIADFSNEDLVMFDFPKDADVFPSTSYQTARKFFNEFVEVTEMYQVNIPGVSHPDSFDQKMPIELASFYLEVVCIVRQVSVVASGLHEQHMVPPIGRVEQERIYGDLAFRLRLFQILVSQLDLAINSEKALLLERLGWQLPQPLPSLRDWAKAMSRFAGKCQTQWLLRVSKVLKAQSEACSAAIPSWSACFENGRFLEEVARRVLAGRLAGVVTTHNALHSLMGKLGASASELSIAPRLQDNELSLESVRISFDVMARASQASIVCCATDIILRFQLDSTGSASAKQFLSKYKHEEHNMLPPVLWSECEAIASHAADPAPSSPRPAHGSPKKSRSSTTASTPASDRKSSTSGPPRDKPMSDSMSATTTDGASPAAKKRPAPTLAFASSKKARASS